MNAKQLPSAESLLKTYTSDYDIPSVSLNEFAYFRNRVPFRLYWDVPAMMLDPRIQMALWYIKGSILSMSRFFVDDGTRPEDTAAPTEQSPIKQFVINQINRWWRTSVIKQMSAIEWGYSGCEVMYCVKGGLIQFDHLRLIHQRDVRAVTQSGSLVGMAIENNTRRGRIYLGGPKSLWHVHQREVNPYYGRSRLKSAFDPWTEMQCQGGARDVRKLYFYRQAFQGDTLYYPPGSYPDENGQLVSNREVASRMLNAMRTGSTVAMPSQFDSQTGHRLWEMVPRPESTGDVGLLTYYETLKKEMAEGVGVPTEVIEASETGSGYSGRRVPKDAFLGMLSDPVNWLVSDFSEQVITPLVQLNFGIDEPDFEIIPFGLVRDDDNNSEDVQNPSNKQVPQSSAQRAQFSLCV